MVQKCLCVFDHIRAWQETEIDLERLPDSPNEMPSSVSGRVRLADGDRALAELSRAVRVIFNDTQVQYRVEQLDVSTGRFTAVRD